SQARRSSTASPSCASRSLARSALAFSSSFSLSRSERASLAKAIIAPGAVLGALFSVVCAGAFINEEKSILEALFFSPISCSWCELRALGQLPCPHGFDLLLDQFAHAVIGIAGAREGLGVHRAARQVVDRAELGAGGGRHGRL